jgi:hypothetical protein
VWKFKVEDRSGQPRWKPDEDRVHGLGRITPDSYAGTPLTWDFRVSHGVAFDHDILFSMFTGHSPKKHPDFQMRFHSELSIANC